MASYSGIEQVLNSNEMHSRVGWSAWVFCCLFLASSCSSALGQTFGTELGNSMMPASGGMGGTSLSKPQDVLSALHGNPATLRQFEGSHFTFSGGWLEYTYNISHEGNLLPGVDAFSAKSASPGQAVGNIGVSQEFEALGRRVTVGVAMVSAAGAGLDVVHVPESNGTASTFEVLEIIPSIGFDLTDRLSAGVGFGAARSTLDGILVGESKNTLDYGVRATFGLNYELAESRSVGAYCHLEERFTFHDAVTLELFNGRRKLPEDIKVELPTSIGVGFADESFANGRLLLATDIVYRFYGNAEFFRAIFDNQLAVNFGGQYDMGRYKLRFGYVWAENLMKDVPDSTIGGVAPPGGVAAIEYVQAQFAAIAKHRISAGIGVPDVLPGLDLDLFVGGMFENGQEFGESAGSIEGYWMGGGLSWHFGRPSRCDSEYESVAERTGLVGSEN